MGWADGDGNRGGPGGVGMGGRDGGRGGDRGSGGNDRDSGRNNREGLGRNNPDHSSRTAPSVGDRLGGDRHDDYGGPPLSRDDAPRGNALTNWMRSLSPFQRFMAGAATGQPAVAYGAMTDTGGKALTGLANMIDRALSGAANYNRDTPSGGRDPVGGGGGEGGGYLPRLPTVSLPVVAAPPPAAPEPVSPFAQFDEEAERLRLKFEADAARNRLPFQFGRPLSPLDFTV